MPRIKIVVPEKLLTQVDKWALFQLFTNSCPLWENLKLIQTDDQGKPLWAPRRGEQRTLRLSWGIDAGRFARSTDYVRFVVANPDTNRRLEQFCSRYFTVAKIEAALGKENVDKERARLEERRTRWRANRTEQDDRNLTRAWNAALEEDAAWNALYRD